LLAVSGVSKEYPSPSGPLRILSDVSLNLEPGSAISVMGPSGSGKSTLLYILGGLESPSGGTVTLNGKDVYKLKDDELSAFRRDSVGFVFQDHCLLPQCTVLENVLIPTPASPSSKDPAVQARARTLLDAVGLGKRLDHRPGELSGGEKQRCAIARALILSPGLLLCDEPTGNLDRTTAAQVADLLFDLHKQQQTILIVVTHSLDLAKRFAVRYEMDKQTLQPV
jgi:lipoprotein-releasing system ATP-binding protein